MEENKEVVEEVKEETTEEIKNENKEEITADNENIDVEVVKTENSQSKSKDEQEEVKTEIPQEEGKTKIDTPSNTVPDFSVYQKQLEEMKVLLEGLKKTNEELANSNKEMLEKNAKLEKDISDLRESPFYKSSKTTSDLKIGKNTEYAQEDLDKYRRII